MEIRLMEYVVAVAEEGSFTRAAARLCVAQPSLSQQIAKLERDLGVRLFHRSPRTVSLTPDGMRFVHQARSILRLQHDLRQEMVERSQGMGDTLTIGTTAITGGRLLPRLLHTFQSQYPSVQPRLVEDSTEALTEMVVRGGIDLAILPLPLETPELSTVPVLTEPLLLALPPTEQPWMSADLRTSQGQVLPLSTVAHAPFVVLKQGFGFRRTLLALCANEGFQPIIAYETSSIYTAQALVAHGLGVTIVPDMVAHSDANPSPRYVRIDGNPTRSLVFAYPRDRYLSLAARAFLDLGSALHN